MLSHPLLGLGLTLSFDQVLDDVSPRGDDVLSQEAHHDRISSFVPPMAPGGPGSACHAEISTHVVPRMLRDVVQTERRRCPAQAALLPHEVHGSKEFCISDPSEWLRVRS